jgi:hypothetical protein
MKKYPCLFIAAIMTSAVSAVESMNLGKGTRGGLIDHEITQKSTADIKTIDDVKKCFDDYLGFDKMEKGLEDAPNPKIIGRIFSDSLLKWKRAYNQNIRNDEELNILQHLKKLEAVANSVISIVTDKAQSQLQMTGLSRDDLISALPQDSQDNPSNHLNPGDRKIKLQEWAYACESSAEILAVLNETELYVKDFFTRESDGLKKIAEEDMANFKKETDEVEKQFIKLSPYFYNKVMNDFYVDKILNKCLESFEKNNCKELHEKISHSSGSDSSGSDSLGSDSSSCDSLGSDFEGDNYNFLLRNFRAKMTELGLKEILEYVNYNVYKGTDTYKKTKKFIIDPSEPATMELRDLIDKNPTIIERGKALTKNILKLQKDWCKRSRLIELKEIDAKTPLVKKMMKKKN